MDNTTLAGGSRSDARRRLLTSRGALPRRLTPREALTGWGVAFVLWCLVLGVAASTSPTAVQVATGLLVRAGAVALYAVIPSALVGLAVLWLLNRWPRRPMSELAHVGLYAAVTYALLVILAMGRAALAGEPAVSVWAEPWISLFTVGPALCSAIGRAAIIPLRRRTAGLPHV